MRIRARLEALLFAILAQEPIDHRDRGVVADCRELAARGYIDLKEFVATRDEGVILIGLAAEITPLGQAAAKALKGGD